MVFELTRRENVIRFRSPGVRCVSTTWTGGFSTADACYSFSVPKGWDCTELSRYAEMRRNEVGYTERGPALFTAVDGENLRGARLGPVEVYATVGMSNPAELPMNPEGSEGELRGSEQRGIGTVNLVVGTERSLRDGALSTLLAVAVEAKAVTLFAETGFPGTTTDAVIVVCNPDGKTAQFAGSATEVGAAARACVRDVVQTGLRARYPDDGVPRSVDEAEYGVTTHQRARVFEPDLG